MLLSGRLGDRFGHRNAVLAGLALVVAASVAAGMSRSIESLIAARGPARRRRFPVDLEQPGAHHPDVPRRPGEESTFGIFAAACGAGAVVGSLAGGLIVDAAGWPWVFVLRFLRGTLGVGSSPG